MIDPKLFNNIKGLIFDASADLTSYSTMKLKAEGPLAIVSSINALSKLLPILKENKISYRLLGSGTNQLLPTKAGFLFIKMDLPMDLSIFDSVHEKYILPASVPLAKLTSHAARFGLIGWEVFTGIPASLGGAIFMNAGTNLGEIGEIVESVEICSDDGSMRKHYVSESSFSYRTNNFLNNGEVIIGATLVHHGQDPKIGRKIHDYLIMRNTAQPLKEKTCGCIFKNYKDGHSTCRAGLFLDIMGMKGFEKNGIQISPKHANFLVNIGDANRENVLEVINFISEELRLQYGIKFDVEVQIPK